MRLSNASLAKPTRRVSGQALCPARSQTNSRITILATYKLTSSGRWDCIYPSFVYGVWSMEYGVNGIWMVVIVIDNHSLAPVLEFLLANG